MMLVQQRKPIARPKRLTKAALPHDPKEAQKAPAHTGANDPMSRPDEAENADFLADDPSEDSAVRMAPDFAARDSDGDQIRSFEVSARAAENVVPSSRDDVSGDSTLSRYFREMATHQVMGP